MFQSNEVRNFNYFITILYSNPYRIEGGALNIIKVQKAGFRKPRRWS